MLSLPEDWDYTVKGLAYICKDGIDSINGAIKELETTGYMHRQRVRNEKGQLTTVEYTIREYPKDTDSGTAPIAAPPAEGEPEQEIPIRENPIQAVPMQEEPDQLNTYLQTKDKSKKDLLNIEISNPYQSYRDFSEQQLTHNRRSLTEDEIADIESRCKQLYDRCGE